MMSTGDLRSDATWTPRATKERECGCVYRWVGTGVLCLEASAKSCYSTSDFRPVPVPDEGLGCRWVKCSSSMSRQTTTSDVKSRLMLVGINWENRGLSWPGVRMVRRGRFHSADQKARIREIREPNSPWTGGSDTDTETPARHTATANSLASKKHQILYAAGNATGNRSVHNTLSYVVCK